MPLVCCCLLLLLGPVGCGWGQWLAHYGPAAEALGSATAAPLPGTQLPVWGNPAALAQVPHLALSVGLLQNPLTPELKQGLVAAAGPWQGWGLAATLRSWGFSGYREHTLSAAAATQVLGRYSLGVRYSQLLLQVPGFPTHASGWLDAGLALPIKERLQLGAWVQQATQWRPPAGLATPRLLAVGLSVRASATVTLTGDWVYEQQLRSVDRGVRVGMAWQAHPDGVVRLGVDGLRQALTAGGSLRLGRVTVLAAVRWATVLGWGPSVGAEFPGANTAASPHP